MHTLCVITGNLKDQYDKCHKNLKQGSIAYIFKVQIRAIIFFITSEITIVKFHYFTIHAFIAIRKLYNRFIFD